MAWHDERENLEAWHNAARKCAVAAGLLKPEGRNENPFSDDAWSEMFATFIEEGSPLGAYATGNDALSAFTAWMGGARSIRPAVTGQRFTCVITKNYGGASVTFGYEAIFDAPEDKARGAYAYCVEMVNRQFEHYEQTGLAKMRAPSPAQSASGMDTVAFIATVILKENKDGKDYFKIKGGQYEKFGVRVWPEVLAESGIDYESLPYGESPFARNCYALTEGGKVRKVTRIE